MQEWSIQSRATCCEVTGERFEAGQFFYTLLYRDDEMGGLRRRDVSVRAWKALQAEPGAEPPFSFWRSKFTLPPPPAPETLPKADAEGLLRRFLADGAGGGRERAVYILALMLERKKLLKPTDARREGGGETGRRVLCYEHAKTGETFVVTDPELRLDQLAEVQREVGEMLRG